MPILYLKWGLPGCSTHFCGDHASDWKLVKEIPGLKIFNTGSEQDITEQCKWLGKDMIVTTNVPTKLILSGSPKEVYEETKRQIMICKEYCHKGFIVSSGCEVPAYSPPVNVLAMAQATEDYATIK